MCVAALRNSLLSLPWAGRVPSIGAEHPTRGMESMTALSKHLLGTVAGAIALGAAASLSAADARPMDYDASGSGFFVNTDGDVVTNHHVIDGCTRVRLAVGTQITGGRVLASSPVNDLAVVRADNPSALVSASRTPETPAPTAARVQSAPRPSGGMVAITGDNDYQYGNSYRDERPGGSYGSGSTGAAAASGGLKPYAVFRAGRLTQGEPAIALGYPYAPALSDQVKITSGLVSSTAGLLNDTTRFQVSTPINPGNSGGPIYGKDGLVIGASVSGLNNEVFSATQNNNFGIKTTTILQFLGDHGIRYHTANGGTDVSTEDLLKTAGPTTVHILCNQ